LFIQPALKSNAPGL